MPKSKGAIIGAIIGAGFVAVLLIALIVNWSLGNSAKNNGEKKQTVLNAQYLNNQNYLSDCITKVNGVAGVAITNAEKTQEILTEAMKGRYDGNSSAQPDKGALFSAIAEAYPDLSNVNNQFEKVGNVIVGCRTDYRDQQTLLLSKLESFDKWRKGSWTARRYASNFPNDSLVARVGKERFVGDEALKKMYEIVLTEDTVEAYTSGTIDSDSGNPFAVTTTTEG